MTIQNVMLAGFSRYFHNDSALLHHDKAMTVEQPWDLAEGSSSLVCADHGFDRLPAMEEAAGPSGDHEGPACEVGGANSHSVSGPISTGCSLTIS